MKILHTVEFYEPSQGGAQEVIKQLSERMVELGHEVTVATTRLPERKAKSINGVEIAEFDVHGNEVVGIGGEVEKYKEFLTRGDFDIMMNYAAQQWATDLVFEVLDQIPAKKVIVPCGYSALYNPDFEAYFAKLPGILKRYDASIYLSKRYQDYAFAKKHSVRNLHIIPNGANEREFADLADGVHFRRQHGIKGFLIVTIGNHTGAKGHAETLAAFELFPYPATLVIIGKPQEEDGCLEECQEVSSQINKKWPEKQVLLLSLPRTETVAALKNADVFLFLSNVEASPLVLFEANAAQIPFISTDVGNAREIAKWTKGGRIIKTLPDERHEGNVCADISSAVEHLTKLYENSRLRTRLGKKGRKAWLKRFTWEEITKKYLQVYERALK